MKNLLDPAILFFIFGVVAGALKSNLEIPQPISRFLSLYLLMALGLKGGFALAQSGLTPQVATSLGCALLLAVVVPLISYSLLMRFLSGFDAAAIAATYGSVSAVTFVTAVQSLENNQIAFGGYMSAAMALMESPAIILAVLFANAIRSKSKTSLAAGQETSLKKILHDYRLSTSVGDEGGFAPNIQSNEEAIETVLEAITAAGYKTGSEIVIAMDAANSELWNAKEKKYAAAISLLQEATKIEDALNYNEPPDWFFSVRHHLGAVLIDAEKIQEAQKVYEKDLKNYPKNGWALKGLMNAYEKIGNTAKYNETKKQFEKPFLLMLSSLFSPIIFLVIIFSISEYSMITITNEYKEKIYDVELNWGEDNKKWNKHKNTF